MLFVMCFTLYTGRNFTRYNLPKKSFILRNVTILKLTHTAYEMKKNMPLRIQIFKMFEPMTRL